MHSTECYSSCRCCVSYGVLAGLPASQLSQPQSVLQSTWQHDWTTASLDATTWHHCRSSFTGCLCQNAWTSSSASWYITVCMVSALNISRIISISYPRFNLTRDCIRPPVPMLFLPHAGLHLATAYFWLQELEHGMHYRPVSPPCNLSLHSGDSWKRFCSIDNCVNNINYCVTVLKRLHSALH